MALSWAISPAGLLQANRAGLPWWAWLLIILAAAAFLVWLMGRQKEDVPAEKEKAAIPTRAVAPEAQHATSEAACTPISPMPEAVKAEVEHATPRSAEPDDLKIIEGIGPKIDGILRAAGITTFAQLAATDVERVREILHQAGLTRISDPTTWGEQAALAAAGKWEDLQRLQDSLKGGRRVEQL